MPIGGLDSIAPFATLFAGQDQQIVVLTDGLMSHPRRLEGLWERGVLQFGRILRPALYIDREDAQVEDLLGRALYRELVTGGYSLEESACSASERRWRAAAPGGRGRAHFASMPPWAPRFDSFAPGVLPVREHATCADAPGLDAALDRFEKLFRDLNSLLTD